MKTKINNFINNSYGLVDVTLRDAHQCLWSTRMTTPMMTPILTRLDEVGYEYINILGGAVFDVQVRYLKENPWERIGLLCDKLRTPCDALTRGKSLYTFELFPDDLIELNSKVLSKRGIKVLTVYDALNDINNLKSSIKSAQNCGLMINAMIVYSLSPIHTDNYFVDCVSDLVKQKVNFISVKDPTGLLTPERAKTLFPALVAEAGVIPLQLHMHSQSGLASLVHEVAMINGFSYGHTASEPLANGASHPSAEDIDDRARALGITTGIDRNALSDVSGYFGLLTERLNKPKGKIAIFDPELYKHQVPGGMISNLRSQLISMQMEHRLPEILKESEQVRKDLGYPILVSPFAQYVITQSVLNVVQGERYKTIPNEVRKYAMGFYGRIAGKISDEILIKAKITNNEREKYQAESNLKSGLPRLRHELGASANDEDILLAAFYDRSLLAKLVKIEPQCRFVTSPIQELVRYVESRKNISLIKIKYENVEINIGS